jgi:hypothetical protein
MASSSGTERQSARWLLHSLWPKAFLQSDMMAQGDGRHSRSAASTMTGTSVMDGTARQSGVGARKRQRNYRERKINWALPSRRCFETDTAVTGHTWSGERKLGAAFRARCGGECGRFP